MGHSSDFMYPILKNATYQDYTLSVQRQEWAFHTYLSLAG